MITEILVEESIAGWKEYELEVMRDHADNVVIVCSIENFDPMGVHTGDSITVAPAQTLTDREYQRMRDAAVAIIREIGVETGGSNIQFAIHPGQRPHGGHRDEPPRLALVAPSRRRQRAFPLPRSPPSWRWDTRWTSSRMTSRRSTPACYEPSIDYCGREDPPLRRLKSSPPPTHPHHPDEVRGRGDGHRPHLQGGPAERDPRAGDQAPGVDRGAGGFGDDSGGNARPPERGAAVLHLRGAPPRVERGEAAPEDPRGPVVPVQHEGDHRFRGNHHGSGHPSGEEDGVQRHPDCRSRPGYGRGVRSEAEGAKRDHTRCTSWWIPVPRSSRRTPRTTIPPTTARTSHVRPRRRRS